MEKIGDGAEAIIYRKDNIVIKDRIKKSYRHPKIDEELRRNRTRSESKLLQAAKLLVSTDKSSKLEMKFIEGQKVRNILDADPTISFKIGKAVAKLHELDIVHGDLTTSNMILEKKSDEVTLIDFGLSYKSKKVEDKAVDIHLFKQALESKHYKVFDKAYEQFLKGYESNTSKEVIERLKAVEKRGRYKSK